MASFRNGFSDLTERAIGTSESYLESMDSESWFIKIVRWGATNRYLLMKVRSTFAHVLSSILTEYSTTIASYPSKPQMMRFWLTNRRLDLGKKSCSANCDAERRTKPIMEIDVPVKRGVEMKSS